MARTTPFCKMFIWAGCISGLMLASCRDNPAAHDTEITDLPVKIDGQKNWSFFGSDGKLRYENILPAEPSLVVNGIFSCANADGTYALFSASADAPAVIPGCGRLYSVGWNHNGLIPVCQTGKRISVVNVSGEKQFELQPVNGAEIVETALAYYDDRLMVVTADGLYGFVDTKGNLVVKPKYYSASNYGEGRAMVEIPGQNPSDVKVFSFIDTNGNTLFDVPSNIRLQTYRYLYGRIVARTDKGQIGFLDAKGKFEKAIDGAIGIGQYNYDYYTYLTKEGLSGVVSFKGDKHLPARYESIEILPDQTFLVSDQKGKFRLFDRNGIEKLAFNDYEYVKYVNNFGFVCRGKQGSVLLNRNGRRELAQNLSDVSFSRSASIVVRSDAQTSNDIFSQLGMMVTPYGFSKFKIGMPFYVFVRREPNASYASRNYIMPKLLKDGENVRFTLTLYADRTICHSANPAGKGEPYEFDKGAHLRMIQVDAQMTDNSWFSAQVRFTRNIMNKGYRLVKSVVKEGTVYRLYKAMDNELILFYNESEKRMRILISDEKTRNEVRRNIFGEGIDLSDTPVNPEP